MLMGYTESLSMICSAIEDYGYETVEKSPLT